MAQLDGVLPVIGAVADVADQDILVTAAERYSVLRRFAPQFLAAFDFRSNTPNDPVLAAVDLLRAMASREEPLLGLRRQCRERCEAVSRRQFEPVQIERVALGFELAVGRGAGEIVQ